MILNKKDMFIKKANELHNFKYDYSLVEYKGSQIKVKIICPIHGIFEQIPANHSNRYGCDLCGGTKTHNKESFIKDAIIKHNDFYDYSLVKYTNNKTKVDIICPIHGIFSQKPNNHLIGQRCPQCFGTHLKKQEDFINEVNIKHDYKYNYSLVEYKNAHKKIKIICPEHGYFEIKPIHHLNEIGCSKCNINISKGENKIKSLLIKDDINFENEKSFDDLKDKSYLYYDFYLPEYNLCIEFDGKQHFEPIKHFGGEKKFLETQKRDNMKNQYCKDNNIKLIRIPYWDYDNIESILQDNIDYKKSV